MYHPTVQEALDSHEKLDWLFLDLNSFFASCEQQNNPKLVGKPIAVVPLMSDTTCAIAASYEAKKFGIKTGTLVKDAKKLCPDLILVEASHSLYIDFHDKILDAIETCIPIETVHSVDEVSCKLLGSQREPQAAIQLSEKIKKAIYSQVGVNLTCSIGLSTNTLLAKMGTDLMKPNGLVILTKKNTEKTLSPLSVREIPGVGPRMQERLNLHGIFTIGDLYRTSRPLLKKIWGGIVGERYYDSLRGETPWTPKSKTRSLGHQHVLEPKLRNPEDAIAVLKKLAVKAARRLRKNNLYTNLVSVSVRLAHQQGHWDASARIEESQDTAVILKTIDTLWKSFPSEKPFCVGVTFGNLAPQSGHQLSFFERKKDIKLSQSMDEINNQYGKDTIQYASVHEFTHAAPTRISFQRIPEAEEFNSDE